MKVRRQINITLEGWAYLLMTAILTVGAIIRNINVMFLFTGMLSAAMWLNWRWIKKAVAGIHVRRLLPQGVQVGEIFHLEYQASRSRGRKAIWGINIADQLCRVENGKPLSPQQIRTGIFGLTPRGICTASSQAVIMRRGRYRLGPHAFSSSFPLGLVSASTEVHDFRELTVYPRLGELLDRGILTNRHHEPTASSAPHANRSVEGEFQGLRDWRSGDSRRWIHWRTSARRGEIMVRQYEKRPQQELIVMLDLWDDRDRMNEEKIETAVSFTGTILSEACRRGMGHATLGIGGRETRFIQGQATSCFLPEILHELALCEPISEGPSPEFLEGLEHHARKEATIILVTTRPRGTPFFSKHPNDFKDHARFKDREEEAVGPAMNGDFSRVQIIHADREELSRYYAPLPEDSLTQGASPR